MHEVILYVIIFILECLFWMWLVDFFFHFYFVTISKIINDIFFYQLRMN